MKTVFGACKTNNNKIRQGKGGSAHEIHDSGLYYGDNKIIDIIAYEYTRLWHDANPQTQNRLSTFTKKVQKEFHTNLYIDIYI